MLLNYYNITGFCFFIILNLFWLEISSLESIWENLLQSLSLLTFCRWPLFHLKPNLFFPLHADPSDRSIPFPSPGQPSSISSIASDQWLGSVWFVIAILHLIRLYRSQQLPFWRDWSNKNNRLEGNDLICSFVNRQTRIWSLSQETFEQNKALTFFLIRQICYTLQSSQSDITLKW